MARCRRQDVRRGNCGLTSILHRESCPAANAPRIARPIRGWQREESFVRLSLQQCFLTYRHSSGGYRARTVPVPTTPGAIRPPLARQPWRESASYAHFIRSLRLARSATVPQSYQDFIRIPVGFGPAASPRPRRNSARGPPFCRRVELRVSGAAAAGAARRRQRGRAAASAGQVPDNECSNEQFYISPFVEMPRSAGKRCGSG